MLRALESSEDRSWLGAFSRDFQKRFLSLLSYKFREFGAITAVSIDQSANSGAALDGTEVTALDKAELDRLMSPFDLKRLESYASNMLDYHVILDLMPTIANLYFTGRIKADVKLSGLNECVLLAIGLQRKDMDTISDELSIQSSQLLAMFIKILRKITTHFGTLVTEAVSAEMPAAPKIGVSLQDATGVHDDEVVDNRYVPLETSLDDELEAGGDEALKALRQKQRELIDSLPLDQYEIEGDAPAWEDAENQVKAGKSNTIVSVKTGKQKRKAGPTAAEIYEETFAEKPHKKAKKGKKDR
jgi:N-acetyltransferase 10